MLGLPRRWLRQIFKIVAASCVLTLLIICTDFYFNFLPTTVQTRLPLHQPGVVVIDLKIEKCITLTGCLGEEKDGWYRIPKEIYLGSLWTKKAFVYSKRVKEEELHDDSQVVLKVALDEKDQVPDAVKRDIEADLFSQERPSQELIEKHGWKQKGDYLWIKYGKFQRTNSVTAVDLLFGRDAVDPRPGWTLVKGALDPEAQSNPRLTLRVGPKQEVKRPVLRVKSNGQLKILQVADLHFSTGVGKCRDPVPAAIAEGCEADPRTLEFVDKILDEENPDFVVLTGDQVFGESAPDAVTAMFKAVAPFIKRSIPFAMVFGNHDDEGSLSREELMTLVSGLPFSLSEAGPNDVEGVGNYIIQALAPKSDNAAVTFYFLDSHSRSTNPKASPGYDYIKDSQLEFLRLQYREKAQPAQSEYSLIPLSMAFFHIPIPEYRSKSPMVGSHKEGVTAPQYNTGVKKTLREIGVSVLSVGHDHVNDYCMYNQDKEDGNIWLCYGGGVGEGGYGGYGNYVRRLRVFNIDTQSASISSWKLVRDEADSIDLQVLVDGGEAVYKT
jgi:hypothetical protein